jgi:DNA-binding CsgD family transcriptional regulator
MPRKSADPINLSRHSEQDSESLQNLKSENQRLRELVVSLTSAQLEHEYFTNRRSGKATPATTRSLTRRELEVLKWMAIGKSAWEIGQILQISQRTVEVHTRSATQKLGAVNKTQAVTIALLHRLIDVDELTSVSAEVIRGA